MGLGFLPRIGVGVHKLLAPLFLRWGIAPPAGTFYAGTIGGAIGGAGIASLFGGNPIDQDEGEQEAGLFESMHVMMYTFGATVVALVLLLGWKALKRTLK